MANNLKYDLRVLATGCVGLVVLSLLSGIVTIALAYFGEGGLVEGLYPSDPAAPFGFFDYVQTVVGLSATIASAVWIYRASANASQLQPLPGRITPGWALGWFFIPIMNFWKPYQAMRQCWNSSTDPTARIDRPVPGFLLLWWLTWLSPYLLAAIGGGMIAASGGTDGQEAFVALVLLSTAISAVSSFLFIRLIRSITKAQRDASPGLAAVFA
jgi:hypothetical protein